jgi:hypothetical protein
MIRLAGIMRGASLVLLWTAITVAAPFSFIGMWLDRRADDLSDPFRRGRKQNWLWRWAHSVGGSKL